ncbi:MAG: peptidylprolyl isomerase [Cyanobacteria bacterium]|nr:peptidylprolyl isomerase [Cyanobacteriota bacterium]
MTAHTSGKAQKTLFTAALAATLVLGSLFPLSGCALLQEKVATVDGTVITKGEYDETTAQFAKMMHIDLHKKNADGKGGSEAENPMIKEVLGQMALNKLIFTTLIKNDAQKLGVVVADTDVAKFKDEQIKKMGSRDGFLAILKQNEVTEADFDKALRMELLVQKFVDKQGASQLVVSDAEAERYFASHPTEFDVPERIKASHILFKVVEPELKKSLLEKNPKLSDAEAQVEIEKVRQEKRALAEKVLKEVQANQSDFANLAKKYSEDPGSGTKGGDLNYVEQRFIDPVFWAAAKKTKVGGLYPNVLESQFGFHIIEVNDVMKPHKQSFDAVKKDIVSMVQSSKRQQVLQTWMAEKKKVAKIEIEDKYKPKMPAGPQMGGPQGAPEGPGQAPPVGAVPAPGQ